MRNNIQKNLMMQIETCKRLEKMSRDTGLGQGFLVQYLIDDFYINQFQHSEKSQTSFNFLHSR